MIRNWGNAAAHCPVRLPHTADLRRDVAPRSGEISPRRAHSPPCSRISRYRRLLCLSQLWRPGVCRCGSTLPRGSERGELLTAIAIAVSISISVSLTVGGESLEWGEGGS